MLAASEVDLDSLPARLADRTVCIGPGRPSESYLKVDTIVQAALGVKADAIHPGYGFLSERAALARLCEQEGVIFIGPTAAQIDAVGDKLRARAEAEAAGVPTAPGGAGRKRARGHGAGPRDRPSAADQSGWRRRRPRDEARRPARGSARGHGAGCERKPELRSAMRAFTSNDSSRAAVMWKSRFSATATVAWFISASATVQSSAVIRS